MLLEVLFVDFEVGALSVGFVQTERDYTVSSGLELSAKGGSLP